ncbi:MAG: FliI/YscN family ATPase [Paracoccaceae bacterium]
MHIELLEDLIENVKALKSLRTFGRVSATDNGQVRVTGLTELAKLGDQVRLYINDDTTLRGEVIQICDDYICIMPDGDLTGLQLNTKVELFGQMQIAPHDSWLGRLLDANAEPMDGKPLHTSRHARPLFNPPPDAALRKGFGPRLETGCYALNTVLPLVAGQRLGLFAGSGVGKSTLLGTLVKNVSCDVVVMALIGERGREVRHFTDTVLGPEGMKNCVVVAATSDRSALERRRCAWTAMTIAEHFRDAGKSVLFVADSITRFAEAHREVASSAGEIPVLRGHPPSTAQMITSLCERAGPGTEGSGDITAVLSVLVQGSDMEEPIADILRGVLDGHIVLDREIAERGRYPAINLLKSVSRSLPAAASDEENNLIKLVRKYVSYYEENVLMVRSGLYTPGTDAELDLALKVWPDLDGYLGTVNTGSHQDNFDRLKLIFRRAGII